MMVVFYILIATVLVIIKTTLADVLFLSKCYDLLIPIIIYLSFFRTLKEGAAALVVFGLIMDSLSGAPMGLYLITYCWLYAGMRWLSQYMHAGNILMLGAAAALGVVFETLSLVGYMVLLAPDAKIPVDAGKTVALQIVLALFTGPLIISAIARAQKHLEVYRSRVLVDR